MGCVVAKNPKEKPRITDQFRTVRPVLQLHATDSLTKMEVLCDQIRPRVKAYYDDFCLKQMEVQRELDKKAQSEQLSKENLLGSAILFDMIDFNVDEGHSEEEECH